MSAAYLEQLTRPELDELMHTAEHAERMAMVVFRTLPIDRADSPQRLADACGVAQDCRRLAEDCYEASFVLMAAEFDRVFDLGGDNG